MKARPLEAARALSVEAGARGWAVDWVREFPDHARLLVATDAGPLLVDLVLETVDQKPVVTVVGPTVSERDAAVGKLVALFDRAEARDFVDVSSSSVVATTGRCSSVLPDCATPGSTGAIWLNGVAA